MRHFTHGHATALDNDNYAIVTRARRRWPRLPGWRRVTDVGDPSAWQGACMLLLVSTRDRAVRGQPVRGVPSPAFSGLVQARSATDERIDTPCSDA